MEQFLWTEKYRPKTIKDTILPDDLKKTFQKFVDQKNVPNLLLTGTSGVGKTTVAKAMLDELDCDYIVINGSLEGRNIDTVRTDILQFASSVSFKGTRKYVIIDEADYMNANTVQPSLRNFIEEFSSNCGFILTCNYKNRIIAPIHSRCSVVEFKISKKDKANLAVQFLKRVEDILAKENIGYEKSVLVELITKYFPDWRRVLNELQRHSASGKIDSTIFINLKEDSYKELVGFVKNKKYDDMRKWVADNSDSDPTMMYRYFYDTAHDYMKLEYIPLLVMTIARYQYQSAFVADQEINFMAFLSEIMTECREGFK